MKAPAPSTNPLPGRSGFHAGPLNVPVFFFLLAICLSAPLAYLMDVPERDVANRYAPMAEAFAGGSWGFAFHPRVPMFHSALCGVLIRLFGVGGFTAAKLVSAGCFAAAVFPLFGIMRRVFDETIAAGSLLIYVINPFLLRLSGTGLRENLKCLLLLMMVHAVFLIAERRKSPGRYLYLGAASGLLMITRSEMILFCGLVLFGAMVYEAYHARFPWRSLAGTLLSAAFVCVPAVVNNAIFALPTPEVRYLTLFEALAGRAPSLADAVLIAAATPVLMSGISVAIARAFAGDRLKPMLVAAGIAFALASVVLFVRETLRADEEMLFEVFLTFERAFDPLWSVPALIGAAVRLRDKRLSPAERLLLVIIAVHTLVVVNQIVLYDRTVMFSIRYLVPVSPLGFGWTFCGVCAIAVLLGRYIPGVKTRPATTVLLAAYVFGALFHCLGPLLKDYFEPRHKAVRSGTLLLAEIIRSHAPAHSRAAAPAFDSADYECAAAPGVFFENDSKYCVSAYLAGGRMVRGIDHADFYVTVPESSDAPSPPPSEGDWVPLDETVPMGSRGICTVYRRGEVTP